VVKKNYLLFILVTCAVINCNYLMSQDFSGTHFRNGDLIPYIEGEEEWIRVGENKQPAWCYYNNDPANGPKYGKLYNWYAVADSRGLCPVGWHVPIDSEWSELKFSLIGKFCDEECVGVRLKSDFGWYNNGNGQSIDFKALPSGLRNSLGFFDFESKRCYWWSIPKYGESEFNTTDEVCQMLIYSNNLLGTWLIDDVFHDFNSLGMSIRCIKD
jgi:uncharacterized protein (TIGR02145 family)